MYQLTASDFADTGQWRLIIKIGETGMDAVLENTLHTEIEPQPLCSVDWTEKEGELKNKLEDAVYDHPRLLDDFATKIILKAPLTLFVPTELAEETPGFEEDYYGEILKVDPSDVMSEKEDSVTAIWWMGKGVKGFLFRTFPGARITSDLMDKFRKAITAKTSGRRLDIWFDHKEADLILTEDGNLISASSHPCADESVVKDWVKKLLHSYDYGRETVETIFH